MIFTHFLQHKCKICHKLFANRRILDSHKTYCSWCEGCKDYKDCRHIPNCRNIANLDLMKKQIRCIICGHFRNKAMMTCHMKRKHGIEGWKAKEHPECVPMVIIINYNWLRFVWINEYIYEKFNRLRNEQDIWREKNKALFSVSSLHSYPLQIVTNDTW